MKKRFICLLLCLLLCLSLAPLGALAEAEPHEHTDDCGHDAAVTMALDGEGETGEPGDPVGGTAHDCKTQGHKWGAATGICSECNAECEHKEYNRETKACVVCGKPCDHSGSAVSCTVPTECAKCGDTIQAAHDWSNANGLCARCGEPCLHESWNSIATGKVCANCGYVCPHTEFAPDRDGCYIYYTCGLCGYRKTEDAHDWSKADGVCAREGCGVSCPHSTMTAGGELAPAWVDGVCGICGMSCPHAEMKPDGTCALCGKTIPAEPDPTPEPTPVPTPEPTPEPTPAPAPVHTHSYRSAVAAAARCVTPGVRIYTCACGASYTASIPARGHSYNTGTRTAATCAQPGTVTYTCTVCGSSYSNVVTPATGDHHYEPYTDSDGEELYRCTVCSRTVTAEELGLVPEDETELKRDKPFEFKVKHPDSIELNETNIESKPMEDGSQLFVIDQSNSDSKKVDSITISSGEGIDALLYQIKDDQSGETLESIAIQPGGSDVKELTLSRTTTDDAEGGMSYCVEENGNRLVVKDVAASSQNGVATLSVQSDSGTIVSIEQQNDAQYGYTIQKDPDGTPYATVGAVTDGDGKTLISGNLLFMSNSNGSVISSSLGEDDNELTFRDIQLLNEYEKLAGTNGPSSNAGTDIGDREENSVGEFLDQGYNIALDDTVKFMEFETEYNGQEHTISFMSSTSGEGGELGLADAEGYATTRQELLEEAINENEADSSLTPEPVATPTPTPTPEPSPTPMPSDFVVITISRKDMSDVEPTPAPTIVAFQEEPETKTIERFATPDPDVYTIHRFVDPTPEPTPEPTPTPKPTPKADVQWNFQPVKGVCDRCKREVTAWKRADTGSELDYTCKYCDYVGWFVDPWTGGNEKYAEDHTCVPSGTLITLADGTQKPIESLTAGDCFLVFDHETGGFATAGANFIENKGDALYTIVNLEFSDGSTTRLISQHGYFDLDAMEYVYITPETCADFIGHRFYKAEIVDGDYVHSEATLVDAYVTEEYTGCWELVTRYHLNHYVDGFLSVPGFCEGFFNFFAYDEDLSYNAEDMHEAIAAYGLFGYENLADYMTYEEFAAYPAQYLAVSIGKGTITLERIVEMIEEYVYPYR